MIDRPSSLEAGSINLNFARYWFFCLLGDFPADLLFLSVKDNQFFDAHLGTPAVDVYLT